MKKKSGFLADPDYKTVLDSVPVATADFIVIRKVGGVREFLLGLRTEEPYKGEYFIPGGRIYKGETVEQAVRRNIKRELGIKEGFTLQKIDWQDCFNPPKLGIRWQSILHLHLVAVPPDVIFGQNRENAKLRWFREIAHRWPKPVRQALLTTGFRMREKPRAEATGLALKAKAPEVITPDPDTDDLDRFAGQCLACAVARELHGTSAARPPEDEGGTGDSDIHPAEPPGIEEMTRTL